MLLASGTVTFDRHVPFRVSREWSSRKQTTVFLRDDLECSNVLHCLLWKHVFLRRLFDQMPMLIQTLFLKITVGCWNLCYLSWSIRMGVSVCHALPSSNSLLIGEAISSVRGRGHADTTVPVGKRLGVFVDHHHHTCIRFNEDLIRGQASWRTRHRYSVFGVSEWWKNVKVNPGYHE